MAPFGIAPPPPPPDLNDLKNDASQAVNDLKNDLDDASQQTQTAAADATAQSQAAADETVRQSQASADEAARRAQAAADEAARQARAAAAEAARQSERAHQEAKRTIQSAQEGFTATLASIKKRADRAAQDVKNTLDNATQAQRSLYAPSTAPKDFGWYHFRELHPSEIALAKSVFKDSIDYTKVFLADDYGALGRQWTSQGHLTGNVIIHGGQQMFKDATSSNAVVRDNPTPVREAFIHEMTHVWQAQNWKRREGYMTDSVICQIFTWPPIAGAYTYIDKKTSPWRKWEAEEQAQMVQDWFVGRNDDGVSITPPGMRENVDADWRFKFIKDNIRKGID